MTSRRMLSQHEHMDLVVSKRRRQKALLIGVGYGDWEQGEEALQVHSDVQRVYDLLCDYGLRAEDIVVMNDSNHVDPALVPNELNIDIQMDRLMNDIGDDDLVFFYFAGHGDQSPEISEGEEDLHGEHVLTCNWEKLRDVDLRKHLVDGLPLGANLLAVFDCCHSGSILNLEHHRCNKAWDWKTLGSKNRRQTGLLRHAVRRYTATLKRSQTAFPSTSRPTPLSSGASQFVSERIQHRRIGTKMLTRTRTLTVDTRLATTYILDENELEMQMSPDPIRYTCDGDCPESSEPATAVCISACMDSSRTHEGPEGGFLTDAFVRVLREDPNPTYRNLIRGICTRYHKSIKLLLEDEDFEKEDEYPPPGYSVPQLSSNRRLNMDRRLNLGIGRRT
ncbi:hypothetical protein NEOLEDRAFT_1134444 [Neolentinus lepideus HHB14362 ss-1]|uniref:Peptidase C14 caspase domain-containing protein n=1 Tax=Neolentinus lepideus HHB14362 ss-1 TaxID=1314782 RepID=A0A165S8A3_9AGAM|nr:hypothetical protein NEOLEDRAFT_1134444 [Neolentinus lepideus HHB14362 ss-1]